MKRLLLLAVLAGCGDRPALEVGRDLFSDPSASQAGSNPFSCATCHEVAAQPDNLLPGYTMHDVAGREAFWGGTVPTLLDAMNQCITQFMRGRALPPEDERGRALYVYLRSLSPSPALPTRPLTVVKDIVDVPSGDAGRGAQVWDLACATCHGEPSTGEGRLSDQVSRVPDETVAMFGADPKTGARLITIEKVRHGKFYSVGGNMPLYSLEALSDAQLGDLLAYLETFGLPKAP